MLEKKLFDTWGSLPEAVFGVDLLIATFLTLACLAVCTRGEMECSCNV
jgi:hypothetical protein